MRHKIAIGILALVVIAFVSGVSYLAFAAPGAQSDPLVALSYLTNVFHPKMSVEIKNTEQSMTQKFNNQIAALESQLQSNQGGTAPAPGSAEVFTVVTLRNGQTLSCSVGAEIMLRVGSATGFGSAPLLVNYTSGGALSEGTPLTINNMYLVTIEGNGIKATADTVRVLVRGVYKVT